MRMRSAAIASSAVAVASLVVFFSWDRHPHGKLEDYAPYGYDPVRSNGQPTLVEPATPWFDEVHSRAGIALLNGSGRLENGVEGGGVAIDDVDGDGWPDVVLTSDHGAFLYRNQHDGTFQQLPQAIPLPPDHAGVVGATLADYDGDGRPDLFLARDGPNRLLHNEGGRFEDVTEQAGFVEARPALSFGVSLADYDRDGDLDAFVVNHVYSITVGNVATSRLFRNDGRGHFSDVTELLDVDRITTSAYQGAWTDIDGDGDPDLFVVTDFTGPFRGTPNQLFRNDGSDGAGGWLFTAVSERCVCGAPMGAMGVAVGDYDRDGRPDFYVSDSTHAGPGKGNSTGYERLFKNLGAGLFADVTVHAKAVVSSLTDPRPRTASWGVDFGDFDNDGWLDIVAAFGRIVGERTRPPENLPDQRNALVRNEQGRFQLVEPSGLEYQDPTTRRNEGRARGVGIVDWDLDGCLDVVIPYLVGPPAFFHNRCDTGRHWLGVRLVGTRSNRDAVGAVVRLSAAGATQRQEVVAGSTSMMSSRWKTLHFGLGDATEVDGVEVAWPSGLGERFRAVPIDSYSVLTEGSGEPVERTPP